MDKASMKERKLIKDMTIEEADKEHVWCSKLINGLYDEYHISLHKRREECADWIKQLVKGQEQTFYGESATYMFYAESDEAVCKPDSQLVMELLKNNPDAIDIKVDRKKLTPEQQVMYDRCLHTVKKKAHVRFAKAPKLVYE